MCRKIVGPVILLLIVGVMTLLESSAHAFTLSWGAVTTYTDNTAIEGTKTVYYNVERGGTVVSVKQLPISYSFTSGKGVAETFRVQAELNTGEKSVWSPAFGWTSPLGVPGAPGNLQVAP